MTETTKSDFPDEAGSAGERWAEVHPVADLVAFIRARLDELERHAGGFHRLLCVMTDYDSEDRFCTCKYPDQVRATVAALRRIVDEHPNVNDGDCGTCVVGLWGYPTHGGSRPENWPCPTLRALAAIWRDHEQFDPAWAPEEART